MITVHPEFVVDKHQKRKAVLVTADEWEQIVSELEELDDIRAYDAAQSHADDKVPFEQAVLEIRKDYQA
jgi:PHD/YefM family antitoxin component YafN of YafNO toxin-antitoxin module